MRKVLFALILLMSCTIKTAAVEISAPEVPRSALERMPENTESFSNGLLELLKKSLLQLQPDMDDAAQIAAGILFTAFWVSLLPILSKKLTATASVTGAVSISVLVFQHTDVLITKASDTVWEICEYGKLLCPVMTTALAAQGGISASAALYTGTITFLTFLNILVSRVIVPMLYIFLIFSVSHCALGEETLKRFADTVRSMLGWLLKTLLIVFTSYMSITGVISGTTDMAALKAAKVTVSTVVPVVGSILSDASESLLVSFGIVKNAAGIYGILAVLAVFMGPFLKIGIQYLLLKASAAICGLFSSKNIAALVESFSAAMGLLAAMVASSCLLVLLSTVCFMKGIG